MIYSVGNRMCVQIWRKKVSENAWYLFACNISLFYDEISKNSSKGENN